MPEILRTRNTQVCQRLERYCEECAKIGSTDCINHGEPPTEGTSVLGVKRMGDDAFEDFCQGWRRDDWKSSPSKPPTKRPNAASTNFAILSPPKVVSPSSSVPASFAIPSPPPKFVSPIRPATSLPASAPAAALKCEAATLSHDPNVPSDPCREQASAENLGQDIEDTGLKEGGVRFRENLGKYVVEYRPPRFKWKLWMGTYATVEEGRRACDCARFYAGQDKGGFYFKDSPALFGELGPLNRPFTLVSKGVKDKAFNVELKKRAKQVIRKILDAHSARLPVDVTRPTVSVPLLDDVGQRVSGAGARTNAGSLQVLDPSFSKDSHFSSAIDDSTHAENEVAKTTQQEVACVALEACDPFSDLDPLPETSISSISSISSIYPEYTSYSMFVPGFNMIPDIQYPTSGCIRSSLDSTDDPDGYVELWNHDR